MINLKTEEFVLEMTTLQSLQQLIQWVGDFVLYLLASLPNQVRAWGPENRPRGAKKPVSSVWVALAKSHTTPVFYQNRQLGEECKKQQKYKMVLSVPIWAWVV